MNAVFVSHFATALGSRRQSLEEAAVLGQLVSPPAALRSVGFESHYICDDAETAYDLAASAFRASSIEVDDVDVIVYSTCLPINGNEADPSGFAASRDVKDLMRFPASKLQADFGMRDAIIIGINQQACTGMLGAIRVGRSLLLAEPDIEIVLCITADRFPPGAFYEQAYNLVSDGAAACRLGRTPAGMRLLHLHQLSNGGMVDAGDEQTATCFFAYTCRLIDELTARAGLRVADIDWIVPQNLNRTALEILCGLLGAKQDRVFCPAIAQTGHAISADNVANLRELVNSGRLERGDVVLTFMAGYGCHWQGALLEAL